MQAYVKSRARDYRFRVTYRDAASGEVVKVLVHEYRAESKQEAIDAMHSSQKHFCEVYYNGEITYSLEYLCSCPVYVRAGEIPKTPKKFVWS